MPTASWSDVPAVRSLLARAYMSDPLMVWVFPDPVLRQESVAAWLGLFAETAVAAGGADILEAGLEAHTEVGGARDVEAVAVWRFPGDPVTPADSLPTVAGLLSALVGPAHASTIGASLALLRPLAPSSPSAYVQCLAVDPVRQRGGLGRAVLAPGLARAAARGLGVHLETANPGALPFYEALGFTVSGILDMPGDGPRLWALTGPAPGSGQTR